MSTLMMLASYHTNLDDLSQNERTILRAFCTHADEESFSCFPSMSCLMLKTGMARSSIHKFINRLINLNYLTREYRFRENGSFRSNLYVINIAKIGLSKDSFTAEWKKLNKYCPTNGRYRPPNGLSPSQNDKITTNPVHHADGTVRDTDPFKEHINNTSLPKELNIYQDTIAIDKTDHNFFSCSEDAVDNFFDVPEPDKGYLDDYDYDEDGIPIPKAAEESSTEIIPYEAPEQCISGYTEISFEEFWSEYPLKTAKKAARKVFSRIMKSHKGLDILTPLRAQNRERNLKLRYGMFIPNPCHATTWLNGERWEDVVMTEDAIKFLVPTMAGASKSEIIDRRKQTERQEIDLVFKRMREELRIDFDKSIAQQRLSVDNTNSGIEEY